MLTIEEIMRLIGPVTSQLSAYRTPPSSNSAKDVDEKLRKFTNCYDEDIECFDANTSNIIFPNKKIFEERYRTVFRESPNLDAIVPRRFVITSSAHETQSKIKSVFVIDCETFKNLVKPIGGSLDGSTGLSDEIKEADLAVMYQVKALKHEDDENDRERGNMFLIHQAWFLMGDDEGLAKNRDICGNREDSLNNVLNGNNMKLISFNQVKKSKALSTFLDLARKMVENPEDLELFELSPQFLQATYFQTQNNK